MKELKLDELQNINGGKKSSKSSGMKLYKLGRWAPVPFLLIPDKSTWPTKRPMA